MPDIIFAIFKISSILNIIIIVAKLERTSAAIDNQSLIIIMNL